MRISKMVVVFLIVCLIAHVHGLKIWIPNTGISNKLNWDKQDTPKNCDSVYFPGESDVAAYWNLEDLVISGLSLPKTGDLIFPHNIKIQLREKKRCPQARDLRYIRNEVKGWLDPNNWKPEVEDATQWLPHSERVPCAGEAVYFPPEETFAVQLPNILVPIGEITFDNEAFQGQNWVDFLKTELGFQLFKGSDDIRNLPWRNDVGCWDKKKCICARSSYTIRNGVYKEASPHIFEEAVCLYAMPKCKPAECYFPVVPEGHCCGVCGAVINLEDNTKDGMDIDNLNSDVVDELKNQRFENELKTYVGRTKKGNIQIAIIAENSDDTTKSHILANFIKKKLLDQKLSARISSRISGLTLSSYVFNSISGIVLGTLFAVLILFVSIFYIYTILPKKKGQNVAGSRPFMFARFDNTLHEADSEENLEIGVEPGRSEELPQAFDNPMYSEISEPSTSKNADATSFDSKAVESKEVSEVKTSKEYTNPVYNELNKSESLNLFQEESPEEKTEEFTEIKL